MDKSLLDKAVYLEKFISDYEFPPALYDAMHAVNKRWREEYALVEYNKHNRRILSSALDEDLLDFLESRAISVLFENRKDGNYSIYDFNTHSLTIKDSDMCIVGHEDIDLDPDSFISLMHCILDLFNY